MKNKKQQVIKKSSDHNSYLFTILAITLLSIALLLGYFLGLRKEESKGKTLDLHRVATSTPTIGINPTIDPLIKDWKEYIDSKCGFSFKYPPNWSYKPTSLIPDTRALVFAVTGGDPKKDPIQIVINIKTNPDHENWTAEQWFSYIVKMNNDPEAHYFHMTVGGYPAIKNTQTIPFAEYNIIAPVHDLTAQNAEYTIYFSNIGEGLMHPYAITDPFLQQAYRDFQRVISSFNITK
jgi:hypothetical protein